MSERVLGYSVPVTNEQGQVVNFPAGTRESEIPDEFLDKITNPKAWGPSPVAAVDVDDAPRGARFEENTTEVPASLDDCTVEQLHEIAERGIDGEPIVLGKVRRKDDIIEVLRAAGIDDEGGTAGR